MRQAILRPGRRGAPSARPVAIPPPVGGWNARDPLSGMGRADALALENWIVTPGGVQVRPGRQLWTGGLGAPVETIMDWSPASGLSRLFAAAGGNIFDVSVQTATVGVAVQTGLGNARWQHVNFATPGGAFLYAVNGQDAPRCYNGTGWTSPVISGVSANAFTHVCVHMNRLWFVEGGSLRVWYLPVSSIAGAATSFNLSSLCSRGGELVAMGTWTRDGGSGPDDAAVFVTSRGQALVFSGTDPSGSTTWSLIGIYDIPLPIGRRCLHRLGGELAVLTIEGLVPLSRVVAIAEGGKANLALTEKVSGAFRASVAACGESFGWQVVEHPDTGLLLINIPTRERVQQDQIALATRIKGVPASRLTGLNAGCWGRLGSSLFMGGNDGKVHRIAGAADAGSAILATYQHAFTSLGSPTNKRFTMARPHVIAPTAFVPAVHLRTDLDTSTIPFRILSAVGTGAVWDEASWDAASWADGSVSTRAWQGVEGIGSTVSVAFRVAATAPVAINGVDLLCEPGGIL